MNPDQDGSGGPIDVYSVGRQVWLLLHMCKLYNSLCADLPICRFADWGDLGQTVQWSRGGAYNFAPSPSHK